MAVIYNAFDTAVAAFGTAAAVVGSKPCNGDAVVDTSSSAAASSP